MLRPQTNAKVQRERITSHEDQFAIPEEPLNVGFVFRHSPPQPGSRHSCSSCPSSWSPRSSSWGHSPRGTARSGQDEKMSCSPIRGPTDQCGGVYGRDEDHRRWWNYRCGIIGSHGRRAWNDFWRWGCRGLCLKHAHLTSVSPHRKPTLLLQNFADPYPTPAFFDSVGKSKTCATETRRERNEVWQQMTR